MNGTNSFLAPANTLGAPYGFPCDGLPKGYAERRHPVSLAHSLLLVGLTSEEAGT